MIQVAQLFLIIRKKAARIRKRVQAFKHRLVGKHIGGDTITIPEPVRRSLKELNHIEYRIAVSEKVDWQSVVRSEDEYALDYVRLSLATTEISYDLLITIKSFRTGGTQKLLLNYLQGIQHIAPHLHIAVLVLEGLSCPWEQFVPANTKLLYYQKYSSSSFSQERYSQVLARFIVQYNIQVLWNFNCKETYLFCEENPVFVRDRVIVWGVVFAHWYRRGTLQEYGMAHEHLPAVIDNYDLIISDNVTFVEYLCYQYGWSREKFSTLYIPLSPHHIRYRQKPFERSFKVLWASSIEWNKGIELLPLIAEKISHLPIHIDVYGGVKNGAGESLLLRLNKDIFFKKNISYKGTFTDLSSLVRRGGYSCFLFTSFSEGMPNVVVEAAQEQLRIVSPLVGGLGEFLNSTNAYVVDNKFDVQAYAEQLENAYRECQANDSTKLSHLIDDYNEKFTQQRFRQSFVPILERFGLYKASE